MNQIMIAQAPVYTSPNPMTFICTKKPNGKTNMATLAFWMYASTNPGKVVFSLNKGAYTLELLAKNKEVVIAVPAHRLQARSLPAARLRAGIPTRPKNSALKCRSLKAPKSKCPKIPASPLWRKYAK